MNDQDDRLSAVAEARPEVRDAVEAVSSLVRSSDGFRHRAAEEAQVGLTELRALGRIMVAGSLSPKQLAEALDLTTGTVTALLDRLERAGLVARTPHPRDRRMLQISLTPLGHDRYSGVLANWDRQVIAAAEAMPPEALLATVKFLRRLEGLITHEHSLWGTGGASA
ncbi:MarR family transcriptional regulator [Naasia sp. SYSU D00057]|uniref:MarR family transcriptional regulator n=1 Tax=Naasia sp. SYSU D00057 TaxID=2817380 RepID=UPI001B309241|nr:MarR family transcriptional regulator [Naasia sp. SYSU D00057]